MEKQPEARADSAEFRAWLLKELLGSRADELSDSEADEEVRRGFIRGNAYTTAQMWLVSAEAQLKRASRSIDTPEQPAPLAEIQLQMADLELCLVSLVRFRRAFVLLDDLHPELDGSPFLAAFDGASVNLRNLRDVAEHWDEYSRGVGRREPKEHRGRQYQWGPDGVLVTGASSTVNVTRAVQAARHVFDWLWGGEGLGYPSAGQVENP